MRVNAYSGAILLAILSGYFPVAMQRAQAPLIVESTEFVAADSASGRPSVIAITVRNGGTQTITAWGVSGIVEFADGTRRPIGATAAGYDTIVRKLTGTPALSPGVRYVLQLSPPTSRIQAPPVKIAVEPNVVVFEDGTVIGDEQEAEYLFRRRALEYQAWHLIGSLLSRVRATEPDPASALKRVAEELDGIESEEVRQSAPFSEVRRFIAGSFGPKAALTPAAALEYLAQDSQRRGAAAKTHSQRR